ncbi:MAG: lysophospholipid acyltransferase family protein [Lachnospirales bacterium]
MKRVLLIVLKNLHNIPSGLYKLVRNARHPEKFPEIERFLHIKRITSWILNTGRVNVEVFGKENIPNDNGFMIFPNHQGLFDGFAIVHSMDKPFSTVYKKELDKIPFVSHICRSVEAVSLDRDDLKQGLAVINKVTEEVKNGRNFMIFPEGTRSKNGNNLLEFKGGSFKSATKAKCPIVPMALINSYKVFDEKHIDIIDVEVHILEPILYEEYMGMKTNEIAEKVRGLIQDKINSRIH